MSAAESDTNTANKVDASKTAGQFGEETTPAAEDASDNSVPTQQGHRDGDGDGDVEMKDISETPAEEEEEAPSEEDLLYAAREALLAKLNPRANRVQWKHITDELLQEPDAYISKLVFRIQNQFNLVDEIFHEILYSAKYFPERADTKKLLQVLNSVASGIELMSNDKTQLEDFYFRFVAALNTFSKDENLDGLTVGFEKLPSLTLARYTLHDESPIYIKPGQASAFSRYRKAVLFDLVETSNYNLLIEATEGYSKLIALFNRAVDDSDSYFQVDYINRSVETLIGHFKLDPARALNCLLDIGIQSLFTNYRFIIDFFKASQWWPKGNEARNTSLDVLDKGGNPHVAQLLGLKLKNSLTAKKNLNESTKLFITVMIREGFISFGSIFKYLVPDDEGMEKLKDEVADKIEQEVFKASANALALSGPLVDDDEEDGSTTTKQTTNQPTKEESDQKSIERNHKFIIFTSLLKNGLFWPAVYMLTKYPFLAHYDDEIPSLVIRIFNVVIQPLKEKISPLDADQLKELKTPKRVSSLRGSSTQNTVDYDDYRITNSESFRLEASKDRTRNYIYFYHEWADSIPRAETYDQLFEYSGVLLPAIGAKIGQDPQFFGNLIKFGVDDLEKSSDHADYDEKLDKWFNYTRKYLLPASTYIKDNPITSNDLFFLLKKFPLDWRYNLYGDLNTNISKNNDFVRLNYSKAGKETKDILKRITTQNVGPTMRKLAKITFANPLPSFLAIVSQVESYDNLTDLIVDAARYFTDYAWDVLPFVLLTRLTARRNSIQSDGLNDSAWLQSLSTFIAKLAKGYASFNLEPIITFVLKDLHKGNTVGLTIFRELVSQMGGIQQTSNLSPYQVKLLNSSDALQKRIRKVILDTRDDSTRSAERLIQVLLKDNQLSELFILLTDFNRNLVEKSSETDHFKVISNKLDESVAVIHTFTDLLGFFLRNRKDDFIQNVTSLSDLVSLYNVDVPWAFELWRNFLEGVDIEAIDFKSIKFDNLKKELFTDFWKLKLYDINFESKSYQGEITKLEESNKSITSQIDSINKDRYHAEPERQKRILRQSENANTEMIKAISEDESKHEEHDKIIKDDLSKTIPNWFSSETPSIEEIKSFIEYCLVPRAIQSSSDAVFTSEFITSVIGLEVSKEILNVLINSKILDVLIFTLSPLEAESIGLFFVETLSYYEEVRKAEGTSNDLKRLIYQWHSTLLGLVKTGIESENYMSRRNSITVLKNLINLYPVVEDHGEEIVESIKKVSSNESRNDLKLASDAILALINSRSSKWIHLWDFYDFEEEEKEKLQEARTNLLKEREAKKLEQKRIAMLKSQEQARKAQEALRKAREEQEAARLERLEAEAKQREEEEKARKAEEAENAENAEKVDEDEKVDADKEDDILDDDEDIIEDEEDKKPETKVEKPEPKAVEEKAPEQKKPIDIPLAPKGPKGPKSMKDQSSGPVSEEKKGRKFKDVTASAGGSSSSTRTGSPSNSAPIDHASVNSNLRDILNAIESSHYKRLLDLISDRSTVGKIEALQGENFSVLRERLAVIVKGYARDLYGDGLRDENSRASVSFKAFKTRLDHVVRSFTFPTRNSLRKTPLPPQAAVAGFNNRPQPKWGMDNRTYGQSQQSSRGQDRYRSSGPGSGPSSGSGYGSSKRSGNYQDGYNDKRQRR